MESLLATNKAREVQHRCRYSTAEYLFVLIVCLFETASTSVDVEQQRHIVIVPGACTLGPGSG